VICLVLLDQRDHAIGRQLDIQPSTITLCRPPLTLGVTIKVRANKIESSSSTTSKAIVPIAAT
jgi:hypothetical protein